MNTVREIALAFAGFALAGSFSGCLPRYGIANGGGEPVYFSKPVYCDTSAKATYMGGEFCHSIDSAYSHRNETNYFGEIYAYRSLTTKNYNISYGLFGYTGSYKVAKIIQYKGNQSYYGGGLTGEFNINIPFQALDLRILGIRGMVLYEDGDFSNFRKKASAEGLINNKNVSHYVYHLSVSNECEFKWKNSSLGFYGSMGVTKDLGNENSFLTITGSTHYTIKSFTAYVQFTECVLAIEGQYSLGISFKIK